MTGEHGVIVPGANRHHLMLRRDVVEAAAAGDDEAPLLRAEEIRKRIQERREELRRAAEEARESGDADTDEYRSAIQSMISAKSRQGQNEDEQ